MFFSWWAPLWAVQALQVPPRYGGLLDPIGGPLSMMDVDINTSPEPTPGYRTVTMEPDSL
jgi:hypothetical protein